MYLTHDPDTYGEQAKRGGVQEGGEHKWLFLYSKSGRNAWDLQDSAYADH